MTPEISITPPNPPTQDASLNALLESICVFPDEYWDEGSGGATIERTDNTGCRQMMTIAPDLQERKFCLNIHTFSGRRVVETWLSVGEQNRLTEVFEVFDDYHASKGLFVHPAKAAECVKFFAETGKRSSVIEWITPSEVPPESNY